MHNITTEIKYRKTMNIVKLLIHIITIFTIVQIPEPYISDIQYNYNNLKFIYVFMYLENISSSSCFSEVAETSYKRFHSRIQNHLNPLIPDQLLVPTIQGDLGRRLKRKWTYYKCLNPTRHTKVLKCYHQWPLHTKLLQRPL